jgi:hypothetical protein
MTNGFPWAVAVLEAGACVVFAWQGNTRMTILWLGYAVAAFALATIE